MTRIFLLLSFALIASTAVYAQSRPIICGNEIFSDIVRQQYPDLQEAFESTFESALKAPTLRGNDPLTVNVVVHVVWKEEAENLDESIILDQIRVLNEDFNRLNADTSNLRSLFDPAAGSAGIRFELAEIIRTETDVDFEVDVLGSNLLPEVKSTSLGGSDARDPEQHINIWVCKIQPLVIFGLEVGQILGFAFPPNNLPNWPENSGSPDPLEDGVVIDYRVFGSNNPNTIEIPGGGGFLTIKGRTTVHEVGHYLGLRHIWGDGGLLGPNDCAQSDGIDDTPFANAQSAFDCDTLRNTCNQVEVHYGQDVPDLIENYMDYASEDCMNMFTNGQVNLMRNVLLGPRNGLLMPFSSVSSPEPVLSFQLQPNPTDGMFVVRFETNEITDGTIRLLDANGRVMVAKGHQRFMAGNHSVTFDDLSLAPGLYFVELQTGKGSRVEKLIVY
jgi:hypothetical protein